MKPIEVGDQVIVPFEANEPWFVARIRALKIGAGE